MPERQKSTKPEWQRKIAEERIAILFAEAEKAAKTGRLEFANRYIELARKIGMRYNVRITKELKRKFCRYCYSYLRPKVSCDVEVDTRKKIIRVKCFTCNRIIHFPYK